METDHDGERDRHSHEQWGLDAPANPDQQEDGDAGEYQETDLSHGCAAGPARERSRQADADLKFLEPGCAAEPLQAARRSDHEHADRADCGDSRSARGHHPPSVMDDQGDHGEEDQLGLDRRKTKQHTCSEVPMPPEQVERQQRGNQEQRVVLRQAELGVRDLVEQKRGDHGRHQPVRQPVSVAPEQNRAGGERHRQHDLPQDHRSRKTQSRKRSVEKGHHRWLVEAPDEIRRRRGRNQPRNQVGTGELHRSRIDAPEPRGLGLVGRGDAREVRGLGIDHGIANGANGHRDGSGDARERDEE